MSLGGYWHADIVGPTPFLCDLCMATGPAADPCPFHDEHSWDEWITDALREWAWIHLRRARSAQPLAPARPNPLRPPLTGVSI